MTTHRGRAVLAALLSLGFFVGLTVRPSDAADVPRLTGPATDEAGALEGGTDDIETAIGELLRDHDIQLFVLYVATTDDLAAPEFAAEAARVNSLGANDALLLVAIDDRTDAIWVAEGLDEISDAEIDTIIADVLEPRLRDGDFATAAVDAAGALGAAAESGPVAPTTAPAAPSGQSGAPSGEPARQGDTNWLGILVAVGGAALLLLLAIRWLGGGLTARREREERDRRTGRLAREANALLVSTDERVRDAEQEVGYIEAGYALEEVEPFRQAIAEARGELRNAFAIRQRLDDSEPEDPPTREAMLKEIVERCGLAQAALDRQAARIRDLRDLERDAPAVLDQLDGRVASIEARLPAAEAAIGALVAESPASAAAVRGNVAEATKGIAGARAAGELGRRALAKGDRRRAAVAARQAQEGVDGAATLLDAIDKLLANLREARARIPAELAAAESGLAAARTALASAADAHIHEPIVQAAEEALATARRRHLPVGRSARHAARGDGGTSFGEPGA